MIARLGNVLVWIGLATAVSILVYHSIHGDLFRSPAIIIGMALISYAVGWATRYILSGRTSLV